MTACITSNYSSVPDALILASFNSMIDIFGVGSHTFNAGITHECIDGEDEEFAALEPGDEVTILVFSSEANAATYFNSPDPMPVC